MVYHNISNLRTRWGHSCYFRNSSYIIKDIELNPQIKERKSTFLVQEEHYSNMSIHKVQPSTTYCLYPVTHMVGNHLTQNIMCTIWGNNGLGVSQKASEKMKRGLSRGPSNVAFTMSTFPFSILHVAFFIHLIKIVPTQAGDFCQVQYRI